MRGGDPKVFWRPKARRGEEETERAQDEENEPETYRVGGKERVVGDMWGDSKGKRTDEALCRRRDESERERRMQ